MVMIIKSNLKLRPHIIREFYPINQDVVWLIVEGPTRWVVLMRRIKSNLGAKQFSWNSRKAVEFFCLVHRGKKGMH